MDKKELVFCVFINIALLATMIIIAFLTKTAWGLVLMFGLQKPSSKKEKDKPAPDAGDATKEDE